MAQNITLMGASYPSVPAVTLPKTGGGTASFTDVTDTTAIASDVASGKYFYTAAGVKTQGTSSGGGGIDPSDATATQADILLNKTAYIAGGKVSGTMPVATLPTATVSASQVPGSYSVLDVVTQKSTDQYLMVPDGYNDTPTAYKIPASLVLIGSGELTVKSTSTSAASAGTISCGSGAFTKDAIILVHIRDKAGKRNGYTYGSDAIFCNANKANNSTSTFSTPAVTTIRVNSDGTYTSYTGQYGVYGYSINSSGTLTVRRRYNSTYSLTIDGTYVVNVYKVILPDSQKLFA